MQVAGVLDLSGQKDLVRLPAGLCATRIILRDCISLEELPAGLKVKRLNLSGCTSLWFLPAGLRCFSLEMRNTPLISVPHDLKVKSSIVFDGCSKLEHLPRRLATGTLSLRNCTALTSLPEDLAVSYLDISGCSSLRSWPVNGSITNGRLSMRNCAQLDDLPPWLTMVSQLDLRGCSGISSLPENLQVSSWIDIAETGITSLPDHLKHVELRWKGLRVDERIAFRPDEINVKEVLEESNVERRRVLLERVGYERFIEQSQATVIHKDRDPGGDRRLLRVVMPRDEDLVCLAVFCPSTGRQYVLRVPPRMKTCGQAAAWIAGFDNENQYRPVKET